MKRWNLAVGKSAKLLTVLLTVTMSFSLFGCGASTATDSTTQASSEASSEDSSMTEEALKAAMADQSTAHSSENGKEETVYVIADANGTANKVIVSDWLKNGDGASTITDKTSLKDIENVNGYQDYTENDDGTITWNADGADIYYQGTTDKDLPVDVKVSYQLDGKDITPEELAGKSGRVTIRFDYENKQTETVKIDGKDTEIKVPFAMMSGVLLPSDTFSNISVSNGKIMSEGQNTIVVGMAFPGLTESLDIEGMKKKATDADYKQKLEDMDIPEYVEISADCTNFSLDMTMTMAMSNLLSEIDLTDTLDTSDLNESMDTLQASADKLEEGTKSLKDGTGELKDGADQLKDGANTLKDGTVKLKDGAVELKDGTSELKDGTDTLKSGTGELKSGTDTLKSGTSELKSGADKLKSGADTLKAGTSKLASSSVTLDNGAGKLDSGIASLQSGAATLQGGLVQTDQGAAKLQTGATTLQGGLTKLQAGVESLPESATKLHNGTLALQNELNTFKTSTPTQITAGQKAVTDSVDGGVTEYKNAITTAIQSGPISTAMDTVVNLSKSVASQVSDAGKTALELDAMLNAYADSLDNTSTVAEHLKKKVTELQSQKVQVDTDLSSAQSQLEAAKEEAEAEKQNAVNAANGSGEQVSEVSEESEENENSEEATYSEDVELNSAEAEAEAIETQSAEGGESVTSGEESTAGENADNET